MRAMYGLLVWFLRLVTSFFFRTIEVVGLDHVPTEGPVILVGNHPNSLLDPVLITTNCGRKVHFAAKDVLFRNPLLRIVLNTLGAVPIRRRQDHKEAAAKGSFDNSAAFEALFAVLRDGGAFGIFPEGISHANSEMAPLKTGAARIALGSAHDQRGQTVVKIVPCGLTYHRRTRMRQRVLVQFGEPIEIDEARLEAWEEDEREAVKALTADLETAMRALTINAPDWETLRVLDGVRRLYVPVDRPLPLADRAELSRRFLEHYEELSDRPDVAGVYADTSRYVDELETLGISDAQVVDPSRLQRFARITKHMVLLLLFAPLTIPGLFIHAPVFVAAVICGDGLTPRKDVVATTKLMTTVLMIPLAYGLVVAALFFGLEAPDRYWAAASAACLLPLSGWASIRVLERQAALRRGLWVMATLFVLPRELAALREKRQQLHERIWRLVETYADPNLPRILTAEEPT